MTRNEHLLSILAEECSEVAHRASKALRFGLKEKQAGQSLTNGQRILQEMVDLFAVYEMLAEEGALPKLEFEFVSGAKWEKKLKVEHFLMYSKSQGTLQ